MEHGASERLARAPHRLPKPACGVVGLSLHSLHYGPLWTVWTVKKEHSVDDDLPQPPRLFVSVPGTWKIDVVYTQRDSPDVAEAVVGWLVDPSLFADDSDHALVSINPETGMISTVDQGPVANRVITVRAHE